MRNNAVDILRRAAEKYRATAPLAAEANMLPYRGGELKLRMILDRYSVEVFLNDGEQTVTATVLTDLSATGISFFAEGQVEMDIDKYDLFQEVSREKV